MVTEVLCVVLRCNVDGSTGEVVVVTGAPVGGKTVGRALSKSLQLGGVCRWRRGVEDEGKKGRRAMWKLFQSVLIC